MFRSLADGDVLSALADLIRIPPDEAAERAEKYSLFVSRIYENGFDLSLYLLKAATSGENIYSRFVSSGESAPAVLEQCVQNKLLLLSDISALDSETLLSAVSCPFPLPRYECTPMDFRREYLIRLKEIGKRGYGMFEDNVMFSVRSGVLTPVGSPDRVKLSDLIGYERERNAVMENTLALVRSLPADNLLLYGDAGTGKSTTVKAAVNELSGEGLRLVEVGKDQLASLPALMDELRGNPLKFIIFLDDLSFSRNDDAFNDLNEKWIHGITSLQVE